MADSNNNVVDKLRKEREIYNQIAKSLACEYESIYYVDIESGKYTEFSPNEYYESMNVPKNWDDFYYDTKENAKKFAHPDDRDYALQFYDKDWIKEKLSKKRSYSYKYRIMVAGMPRYFQFTVIRANEGKNFVLCVQDIEDEIRAEHELQEQKKKSFSYTQIAESLASNYDVIYYVDIENASFVGYTTKNIFGHMEVQEEGGDFYEDIKKNIQVIIHPDDRERLLNLLTKDNLLSSLNIKKEFTLDYRMIIKDEAPQYTRLTVRKSSDGKHFIIGVENIDDIVKKEKDHLDALNSERELARRDGLTGVKNKIAYNELVSSVQSNLDRGVDYLPFAMALCDLNYLKQTNDTVGHHAGDELIKEAAKLICETFDHSPVFRVGGDEFVVFIRGDDYRDREELTKKIRDQVQENIRTGEGVVVAIGMTAFEPGKDHKVEEIFDRADALMYEDKSRLKTE